MQLPHDLQAALEEELSRISPKDLASAVRDLSLRYRDHYGRTGAAFLRSDLDVEAYIAYRLPATFAAIAAVLDEVRERRPDLEPKTVLDVGAGPGTAVWAAADAWPGPRRITLLERDARMIQIGKSLAARSGSPAIREAAWRQVDVTAVRGQEPADLTIASYVIGELATEARAEFVRWLWDDTADTCVMIEPGTPRGFETIRHATDELVRAGAHILAPFPPDWECLESERDWCHFAARVPRTHLHRTAKEAALSYEDEKYSYVAASRAPGVSIAARVIRHPQVRSGHIRLVLSTGEGVKHVVVSRSQGEVFRRAKDLRWGSAIPRQEGSLYGLQS